MNKLLKTLILTLCILGVGKITEENIDLNAATTHHSSSLGTTHHSSGGMYGSPATSKNREAANHAKSQDSMHNSNYSSKSGYGRTGSFFGGLFLGGLLFGGMPVIGGLFNIFFIFIIIAIIVRLFSGNRRAPNPGRQNNIYNQQPHSPNSQRVDLYNYLDQLVDKADKLNLDISSILNDDQLVLEEKIAQIEHYIERKENSVDEEK